MIDAFCKAVIETLKINKFIETGTYQGETIAEVSVWFAELYPEFGQIEKLIITDAKGPNTWNTYIACPVFTKVSARGNFKIYSVDNKPELCRKAKELFSSNPNISIACQSSNLFLANLIDSGAINESDNCFFYLDAHWDEYWPLHDEIRQILRLKRFLIVIDDFAVPCLPQFSYNTYGSHACGWKYIKGLFKGREVFVYYPLRSNRDNCGWVLIISGYSPESLAFLDNLPLFKESFRALLSKIARIWLAKLILYKLYTTLRTKLLRWADSIPYLRDMKRIISRKFYYRQ